MAFYALFRVRYAACMNPIIRFGIALLFLVGCSPTSPQQAVIDASTRSSVAESSSVSILSGWNTYHSAEGKFQISYPADWSLNERASVGEGGLMGITLKQGNKWGVAVIDMGSVDDATFAEEPLLMFQDYTYDPIQTVMVDGHEEKVYVLSNRDDMEIGYPVEVVSRKRDNTVLLEGFYAHTEDKDAFIPVFKQVVATFKRTN